MKKKLLFGLFLVSIFVFAFATCAYATDVTLNAIDSNVILSNGNLTANVSDGGNGSGARASVGKSSGKWYWEIKLEKVGYAAYLGVSQAGATSFYNDTGTMTVESFTGYTRPVYSAYMSTYAANDVIGIALDADNNTLRYYKNGVDQGLYPDAISGLTKPLYPHIVFYYTGEGQVTANFGATAFTYPVPEGYLPYNEAGAARTLDINAVDTAKVGNSITADVVMHNVSNIYAEDIKVTYDTNLLTYVGIEEVSGLKVYNSSESTPGNLRFIIASQGEANGVNGDKTILKLKFTAKAVGQAKVDIVKGRIADTEQEVDVADVQCGEKIIDIKDLDDVNKSGEFTLLDLAIDAKYHGKTAAETDTTKYNADIVVDGNIDDLDLTQIVANILQNTNYIPNNS